VQSDLLFKIQPPLTLLWFYSPRNSNANMDVSGAKFIRQPGRDMNSAGPTGPPVGLLQC